MQQNLQQVKTISYQLRKASPAVTQQMPAPGTTPNNPINKRSPVPDRLAAISMTVKEKDNSSRKHEGRALMLPKFNPATPSLNTPNLTNYRLETAPTCAIQLLEELKAIVGDWDRELEKVLEQIENVYLEGPIVDGWLECDSAPQIAEGQANNYVENQNAVRRQPQPQVNYQPNYQSYRLCGLDENGQVWCRPCPPEQVQSLTVAIARYQKLQELLTRKQYLETRLSQMAETLIVLRSHLKE